MGKNKIYCKNRIAETVDFPPSATIRPVAPMMAGHTMKGWLIIMSISGRFTKVAETNNSIVVGTIGALKEATYDEVLEIARFYNISTEPDKFKYHCITPEGAVKRGCKLPVNNYNEFIEIFK